MKNLIIILTSFLFLGLSATAQREVSHFMTVTQGYSLINSDELSAITPAQAQSIGDNYLTSTINLRTHINRYIVGAEATMSKDTRTFADIFRDNDDPVVAGANIYSAELQFGYAVIDKPNLKLYPIIGAGMGQTRVSIDRQQEIDASQVVDGEIQGTSIDVNQRNFNTDFGVGFDYIIPCKKKDDCNPDRKYGFVIGAKVGYQVAFSNNDWEHRGGNVDGGPNFTPSGFYAGLTLGLSKSSKGGMFNNNSGNK